MAILSRIPAADDVPGRFDGHGSLEIETFLQRAAFRALRALPTLALAAVLATPLVGQVPVEPGTFSMALTGDAIITRRLSPYREPEFLRMIELIRDADLAFTNLEMLFHDYEPYPAHQSGGTYMRGDPALAKELAWAGIDMVSTANNHTGDYGVEGMRITHRHVEEAGLVHAGSGENLPEAREARFLETAGGRVRFLVERRFGPARVFVNAENLLDKRQTRHDPLVLPARSPEGRCTTDAWAPLEGRAFNAAVRWQF